MRTRDKKFKEFDAIDLIKTIGVTLAIVFGVLVLSLVLSACGGDDDIDTPVREGSWQQQTDPWTGERFHCIVAPQADGIWCHKP